MEAMDRTHQKMTAESLPRLLSKLCVPTVLSALLPPFTAIFEAWLASNVSPDACGALGIVFPIHALIQTIGFVFGTGAGSLVANALGKKDVQSARQLAFGALFCSILLSTCLTIFGLLFQSPLLNLLGASRETVALAKPYAVCLLSSAPLMCACFVFSNLLRAEGKTTRAMLGLAGGNLFCVIFSAIFVFFLDWGTLGIGFSIPIGYSFAFFILFFPYWKKRTLVAVAPIFGKPLWKSAKKTAINGMPSLFRQGLTVVAVILSNHAARQFGNSAITAVALSSRIFLLCYAVPLGIGQGMIPAVGFNYGNGNLKRTKEIYKFCIVVSTVILVVLAVPTAFFADSILQLFGRGDEQLQFGMPFLRSVCAILPLHGLIAITNLLLQVLKKPISASVLAAARQGIFFLPLIFLLPSIFGFTGVWLTQTIADALTFLLALFYAIRFMKAIKKKRPG